jgi:EAL domain-containing protein (putative c-di-GMP-specific phosphodiesterase class I)
VPVAPHTLDHLARQYGRARFGDRHVGVFVIAISEQDHAEPVGADVHPRATHVIQGLVRPNDLVVRLGPWELAVLTAFEADDGPDTVYEAGLAFARRLAIRPTAGAGFSTAVGAVLHPRSATAEGGGLPDAGDVAAMTAVAADLAAQAATRSSRVLVQVDGDGAEPLGRALDRAIERSELRLHLQPVLSLRDGRRTGFEALLRWQRPGHGLLSPDAFLEAAASSALLVPIGRWVVDQAARLLAQLTRAGVTDDSETIGVNVVAAQLRAPDFAEEVDSVLRRHGIAPRRLVLEITEQSLVDDDTASAGMLEQLASLGAQFAIDDFGTGWSSLALLRRLPASIIKIDQSFVASLGSSGPTEGDPWSPRDPAIVRAIIGLAHDLDMITVAEGIDGRDQARWLRDHGCDRGQGWLFGLPAPVSAISGFSTFSTPARGTRPAG